MCYFYISHHGRIKNRLSGAFQRKTELIWLNNSSCSGSGASSGNPELIGDTGYVKIQVLSQFEFLSYVIIWVLEFCHNLSFSQYEFCHNLSCVTIWVVQPFELCNHLSFVTIWVLWPFEFCDHLSFLKNLNLIFFLLHNMSFVTIWVLPQGE